MATLDRALIDEIADCYDSAEHFAGLDVDPEYIRGQLELATRLTKFDEGEDTEGVMEQIRAAVVARLAVVEAESVLWRRLHGVTR